MSVSDSKVTEENVAEEERLKAQEVENDSERKFFRTATLPELNERVRMYFKR